MDRLEEQDIQLKQQLYKSRDGEIIVNFAGLRTNPARVFVVKQFAVTNQSKFNRYNQVLLAWCRIKDGNLATLYKVMLSGGKNPEAIKAIFKHYSHTLSKALSEQLPVLTQPVLSSVLRGLALLRRKEFIHGNVCPENVLFDMKDGSPEDIVLCGQRCLCTTAKNILSDVTQYKNMDYASPELMREGRVTHASDVYSCGLLALQVERRMPIADIRSYGPIEELAGEVADGQLRSVLQALLQFDPHDRPTAEQALAMLGVELPADITMRRRAEPKPAPPVSTSPAPTPCALCGQATSPPQDIECCGYFLHSQCILNHGHSYLMCQHCGAYLIGDQTAK